MKDITQNITYKNFEDLVKQLNALIFDDVIWKSQGLWKIAEVTYSYNKNLNINETLFINIGGLDITKYITAEDSRDQVEMLFLAHDKLKKVVEEKIQLINNTLHRINSPEFHELSLEEELEKEIFENALIEKLNLLEYCLLSLPFELEKAGIPLNMTEEEIHELEKQLKEIDSGLFGGLVKDNPEEVRLSYEYIYRIFLAKKDLLTIEQQQIFEKYLAKIKPHLPVHYQFKKKKATEKNQGKYLKYDLDRKDYILAFNMLVDAFGKLHHVVQSDINAGSISDGPEGIYFPANEKFDHITIERFFKLGMHEIETHSVTDYNTSEILGNLRGAQSTHKDEGTAILMEQLFMYGKNILSFNKHHQLIIDKDKIQINGYFIKTLMGELLSSDELMNFLEIIEIIAPDIIPPIERFKRLKRNNRSGVQHKDTTYTRGLLEAIDQINCHIESKGKKGISPVDLFIGKISFDETPVLKKLKELKKQREINVGELKPIFVSDAVNYVIQHKLNHYQTSPSSKEFKKMLKQKYPLFDFIDEIDCSSHFKNGSQIIGIANILLQTISQKQIEEIFGSEDNNQKTTVNSVIQKQYSPLIDDAHKNLAKHRQNLK